MKKFSLLICGSALISIGCSDIDSENVKTAGIGAKIVVESSQADNTRVSTKLYAGKPSPTSTLLELSSEDKLIAAVGDKSQALSKNTDFVNNLSYEATFDENIGNTEYLVKFLRGEEESLESSVNLPDPFTIETSSFNQQSLTLTWDPKSENGSKMEAFVEMNCIGEDSKKQRRAGTYDVTDTGSWSITLAQLPEIEADKSTCEVSVKLSRINTGSLDADFGEGGSIEGIQSRTVTVSYVTE